MKWRGEDEERLMAICHVAVGLGLGLMAVGLLLLLCGCKSIREVGARSYVARIGGVERVDSTLHPYRFHFVRYFDLPSGAIEREEVTGEGEVMEVVRERRDTLFIAQRDTVAIVREAPMASGGRSVNANWYWWLLTGVALTVAVYVGVKVWRVRV